jgi:hypothetical protein
MIDLPDNDLKRLSARLTALLVVVIFSTVAGLISAADAARINPIKKAPAEKGKAVSCPGTPRKARKAAAADYAHFKKIHPNGVWGGFLHKFHTDYANCPKTIKKIYLDTARVLSAPPIEPRYRQRDLETGAPKGGLYGVK